MSIAELQVYRVEEADVTGGVCVVRCVGGTARAGQVYAVGGLRLGLRRIERYGRTAACLTAGHTARVHLTGAVVALLSRGQVLTSVPPDGHALEELEDWLAGDPPLRDEPHPRTLRILAVGRMQDDRLPEGVRLRWGRVALAATYRCARAEQMPDLARGAELAALRACMVQRFGPGRGGDPAAVCREALALIDLAPEAAAAQARAWRDLPRPRILHLRRIKNLLRPLDLVRPHLPDADPLAEALDAWSAVRPQLP
ncbi:hypothetical protein AMK16_18490 [Streptomyces sp. CB00455]|uniref:hypothetical protein n=1 Tax=Streptomyces sp. CB00455 TaxID=1703927 RepID=UPI00093B6166|nr:hypothetical protein [Streptomyces sp. CB00455]OKK18319.1 hypothetical protein AMK16_18490 [Streptomyces sp. CB00455]